MRSKQFQDRRATIQGQTAVLNTRISELRIEIQGIDTERASMTDQVTLLDDEIAGLQTLYTQDLVPKPRLLAVQRERTEAAGPDRSLPRRQGSRGEVDLRDRTADPPAAAAVLPGRQQGVSGRPPPSARTCASASPWPRTSSSRVDVRAPMSGTAQNLRVFTEGAVVRAGDPLVDIAPDHGQLVIQARVSPNDIDGVHSHQTVEVRFPTFHSRTVPVLSGAIRSVSQDRLFDEATHTPYYLSVIDVDETKLPRELQGRLRAGMPAEVIVPTGARTAFQYIVGPLTSALHKTMRER